MSHRLVLTVPNDHFNWLEIVQKKKGLENIQEAIRSVLEDGYSSYIESDIMQMQTQMQTPDIKKRQMIGVPVSATPQGGGIQ